jgi:hypothetical protein
MDEKERVDSHLSLEQLDVQLTEDLLVDIPVHYQAGARCPECRRGILDYDGLLNLVCPLCGQGQGGCFT